VIARIGSPSHTTEKQDLLADDISIGELMELSKKSGAFDWLASDEEEVYSVEDGEAVEWPGPL
jgi:hypothetical protein